MSALTQIELQGILDQVVCDVTQRICGLPLLKQSGTLSSDVCTVQTAFEGGYEGTIILCADTPLLFRLTRLFLQEESVKAAVPAGSTFLSFPQEDIPLRAGVPTIRCCTTAIPATSVYNLFTSCLLFLFQMVLRL